MKIITATIVASLAALSTFISTPALADVYECTFKEGHVSQPTPTRVVIEINNRRSEGKLLEIDVPGVLTQPSPIRVLRNNIKVASVEWDARGYEFTPEVVQKGGNVSGVMHRIEWHTYRFAVFLNKRNLKPSTRSGDTQWVSKSIQKSGTCIRLK